MEARKRSVYPVEIAETRVVTVMVEAMDEDEAYEKANALHGSSDEICEMLNDPSANVDTNVNVFDPVEPKPSDKVY